MDQRDEAGGCHLPRDLRDPDRPAKLIGRLPPDDHAADIGERALDHEPRLFHAELDRSKRIDLYRLSACARDAEHTDAVNVAEIVLDLGQRRRRLEGRPRPATVDLDLERLARARADDA